MNYEVILITQMEANQYEQVYREPDVEQRLQRMALFSPRPPILTPGRLFLLLSVVVFFLLLMNTRLASAAALPGPAAAHALYLPLIRLGDAPTPVHPSGPAANFFLPYDLYGHIWSNRLPQLVIDRQGVTHIAYVATGNAAVFYGYCSANCTSQASFHMGGLGLEKVSRAELAVDANDHPRLLIGLEVDGVFKYRYAVCDHDCTTSAQWTISDDLVEGKEVGSSVEAERAFALDAQGRPRFVYSIWTVNGTDAAYYLYCNSDCITASNWRQVTLLNAFVENLSLQLAPAGLAQIGYYTKSSDEQGNVTYKIGYLACTTLDCTGSVGPLEVAQVSSGAAAFALRLDSAGNPRIALYPGNGEGGVLPAGRLYYLSCNNACAQNQANWWALDIGLPGTVNGQAVYHGELGVDLALDQYDQPRLAYRIWPYAELGYAWCNSSDCATSAAGWHEDILPSTQAADQELGHIRYSCPTCFPPVSDCASYWDAGWWPAVAVNPAGNTLIAFETQLWSYGGACSSQALARFSRLAVYTQS